ncbi:hypothetical protein [Streptococcus respiraculi]|uniref:hypothetical protein n=1 Tax=Streptococcus respiraculi TaxID=2021971 RepID=UPI000E73C16A|nr:hypothetical protein [Streptococcus respiraculi]
MALRVYSSASYNPTTGKTLVGIKESDDRETVLFNATLDGDHTNDSDADLIKLALDWFTLRYVKAFSDQLLNDKVNEATKAAKASQEAADEAKASTEEIRQATEQVKAMVRTVSLTLNEALGMLFEDKDSEEEMSDDDEESEDTAETEVVSDDEHETTIENN